MTVPSTSEPQVANAAPQWRKFGRGTVLPILLLVALLVLLGHFHIDLASGYTAPRVVGDEKGGFVFYHGGNAGFFYTRTQRDGSFSKKKWVRGVLADATLTEEQLVALFTDKDRKEWFYSVYRRKTLERVWSGDFSDPDLELAHPCHIATFKGEVYVFGTDKKGSLRVARIRRSDELAPYGLESVAREQAEQPSLAGAAVLDPVAPGKAGSVAAPLLFTSATEGGRLVLFWRVEKEEGHGLSQGIVRWTTFDGKAFGEVHAFPHDLAAMSAALDRSAPAGSQLRLFGVPYKAQDSNIRTYRLEPSGVKEGDPIPYQREGLTGAAGVTHLTAGFANGREYLFAQIGGVIRYTTKDDQGAWKPWEDFARRPAEQTAVIYGWFGSLLFLSAVLIYQGAVAFRRRRRRGGKVALAIEGVGTVQVSVDDEATTSIPGEVASIHERAIAFAVDLLVVALGCWLISYLVPELVERAANEPGARDAILTWFVILVLAYFTAFEAIFARTPGKRLMGLEVQTIEGGRPGFAAMLYRNVFRVELLVPPPYLVPLLSLIVMISNPFHQRPGDLVAQTVVRRVPEEE